MNEATFSRRRFTGLGLTLAALNPWAAGVSAQSAGATAPELTAAQAQRDLRILQRAFDALHPGLFRYATAAQLEAAFAAAAAAVAPGASRGQMVLLVSRLAAAVRCGHTWVNPSNQRQDVVDGVFGRADKLPLTLRWVEARALISGSAAAGVEPGSELLAIDGRPVAAIAAALLPLLRADGNGAGADAKRRSQLDSGANGGAMDRLFPPAFAPVGGRFRLTLRGRADSAPRDIGVAAMSLAARDAVLPPPATDWRFAIAGDTALLTLPTFAFWRGGFDAKAFLARTFEQLRGVPYLIVDQRRNEGGDDAIGRDLLSHLLRASYTQGAYRAESAYERVPYELARFLDTWNFDFFDRTGKVSPPAPGERNWRLPERPARRIEPVAAPYAGRTLMLVGPENSSAGFLLARDLQASGAATLLGQATGGNLRGLNGGELAWITLPHSGVGVDIPLVASFAAGDPPDAGVTPDVAVAPRWADVQSGVDTELQAARQRVAAWRAAARTTL